MAPPCPPARARGCEAYAHCRYAREFRLEPPRRIKAGSVIVREYAGVRHEVFVVENGFSWQGKTYPSPSAIAKEITGTRWNGWRFFDPQRVDGRERGPVKKVSPPKPQRCAIYTRKSTEHNLDLEFNSLDAQREACEAYIKSQAHEGWRLVPDRYDDGGLSGASLDRPALQTLLADVRAGKIDIVVVYKVDRLTRSLADFAKLVELFDRAWGLVRLDHPVVQHHLQHGPAHAQRAALLRPVRARGDRRAGARQDRGLQAQGHLGRRTRAARLPGVDKKLEIVPEEADLVRRIFALYIALGSVGALPARWTSKASDRSPASSPTGTARPRSATQLVRSRTC